MRRLSGDRRWLAIGVGILALLVVYFGISWFFSSKLIANHFGSDEQAVFSDFGLPDPEAVTIANGKTKLASWFFQNPRVGETRCAVVMAHGFTGNKAAILSWAPLFWGRGCDLLLFDFRSHGQSSKGFNTYGVHEKQDELAAVDWLEKRSGLPD